MERENIAEQQFRAEQLKIMQENFQVFECTGTLQHTHDCDGNCNVIQLEGWDVKIAEEGQKWNELGMLAVGTLPQANIPGVNVDTFNLECAVNTLVEVLKEKGTVTQEELNERYGQTKYERMVAIREANEKAIKEARRQAEIAIPGLNTPEIILPYQKRERLQ